MTEREQQLFNIIRDNPLITQEELARDMGITRSSVGVHIANLMKKGVIEGRGYVLHEETEIVVVGGANVDICGTPFAPLIAEDSNPGFATTRPGGVGRNIAHNLCLLGEPVRFISAFGYDDKAEILINNCRDIGLMIRDSIRVPGSPTSSYIYITDHRGEMQLAVSDMNIYDYMTPQFIAGKLDIINRAALCVMDTNIPQETIEFLAHNIKVPLFVDPVSTAKLKKLENVLDCIHTFKPNRLEAEFLTGIRVSDEDSAAGAAEVLLKRGIKRVFISMGADGVFCADAGEKFGLPCIPAEVRSTTGGGDCFMAGLVFAYRQGMSLKDSARIALAAASISAESEYAINDNLSADALYMRAGLPRTAA